MKGVNMIVPSGIRFGYFEVNTAHGRGYVCVALVRPPRGETQHRAAFSFCSPKERAFIKSRARQIALSRLQKDKAVTFQHEGSIKSAFIRAVSAAREFYYEGGEDEQQFLAGELCILPGWFNKATAHGVTFGLGGGNNRPTVRWDKKDFEIAYMTMPGADETIMI